MKSHKTLPRAQLSNKGPRLALLLLAYAICALGSSVEGASEAAPPPLPVALSDSSKLACRPVGECQSCPEDLRNDPVCSAYGNRRPVQCIVLDEAALPQQQKHGAPPTPGQIEHFAQDLAASDRPRKFPKLPIVELPPRPGPHPHLLDKVNTYSPDDQSGIKQDEDRLKRLVYPRGPQKPSTGDGTDFQQTFATWEPCARAIDSERKDFWEFILCNFAFAIVALFIVVIRGRMLAARHYNHIVGLIGLKPLQQFFGPDSDSSRSGVVASSSSV